MLYLSTDVAIVACLGVLAVLLVTIDYERTNEHDSEILTTAIVSSVFTSLVITGGYIVASAIAGTL